jgi:His-Xaa-Ser system radical SAM maturase HxsC
MLKLYSKSIKSTSKSKDERIVIKLSENKDLPLVLRSKEAFLVKSEIQTLPEGFRLYFIFEGSNNVEAFRESSNVYVLPQYMCYLSDQDVVKFDSIKGSLNVLYRRNSRHNSFLVTERCNNYCLMCSQPPREIDDSYIIADILEALPLISRETKELGLTGGEPTLLGDDLIKIIQTSKNYLPSTGIHILSNGRNFSNLSYAEKLARIDHHDLMVGIPLYSDISNIHDFVVQADGAYDETIRGIMNLKKYRQKVEIRIVIHQQTYKRLPELAEFITRNLLFVDHIALMGLEMMGFTKHNIDKLWIDPKEYQEELLKAVKILDRFKMNISIYNHQLCLLNKRLWRFNKKSISDWKNEYMPECEGCLEKEQCGGFFSSAKFKYSDSIKPFKED